MAVMGGGAGEHGHEPVMVGEVLAHLGLKAGERVMDCTAGRGGHAVELARGVSPGGVLIALDVDPVNLKYARGRGTTGAIQWSRFAYSAFKYATSSESFA
jgi:16S rRNA C1402 N4-methylase RsmH